jgi:hypothetical protein
MGGGQVGRQDIRGNPTFRSNSEIYSVPPSIQVLLQLEVMVHLMVTIILRTAELERLPRIQGASKPHQRILHSSVILRVRLISIS